MRAKPYRLIFAKKSIFRVFFDFKISENCVFFVCSKTKRTNGNSPGTVSEKMAKKSRFFSEQNALNFRKFSPKKAQKSQIFHRCFRTEHTFFRFFEKNIFFMIFWKNQKKWWNFPIYTFGKFGVFFGGENCGFRTGTGGCPGGDFRVFFGGKKSSFAVTARKIKSGFSQKVGPFSEGKN